MTPEPSDYLTTLLRDPTSSHLLETLVSRSPLAVFSTIWSLYFDRNLARLAAHPVANFVVARTIERLDKAQLEDALHRLEDFWGKLRSESCMNGNTSSLRRPKASRTGVLKALIERTAALHHLEADICEVNFSRHFRYHSSSFAGRSSTQHLSCKHWKTANSSSHVFFG